MNAAEVVCSELPAAAVGVKKKRFQKSHWKRVLAIE
jgi:hypothetical protein